MGVDEGEEERAAKPISYRAMLGWLVVAALAAGAIAYRLAAPYFHR